MSSETFRSFLSSMSEKVLKDGKNFVSFLMFTTSPSSNSLGENFKDGRRRPLRVCIASSKCSGHVFGMSSVFICSDSLSFRSGAHNRLRMCSSNLFAPSTRPLTHGE